MCFCVVVGGGVNYASDYYNIVYQGGSTGAWSGEWNDSGCGVVGVNVDSVVVFGVGSCGVDSHVAAFAFAIRCW